MSVNPTFQPVDDRPGVTVIDPVENKQYPLRTSDPVSPRTSDSEGFYFPVDAVVSFATTKLVLPYVVPIYVRDPNGELLLDAEHYAYETLPEGEYILELMAPIKLYVRVRSGVTIASSDDHLSIDFGEPTDVRLGARSNHDRPAATIATTAEPADLGRAVSTFGSALKTTGCDRSLPSFRGHPPRLELGDELRIPDGIEPPDTGVGIVVPPERTAIYAVGSLAYYLGATVETGANPRIEAGGFEYPLGDSNESFDRAVERVLKQAFFFDCVARTDGFYRVELYERKRADERTEVALDELYDASLPERLEAVLSVPFERIEDLVPRWRLITHATAEPRNATVLPFLVNDLAVVRSASADRDRSTEPSTPPLDIGEFTRSSTRSGDGRSSPSLEKYVSPPDVDAFEQAWLGDGVPIDANKLLRAGFENGLDHSPSTEGVEVTVVCNDAAMDAELETTDGGLYGAREELPFDVTVHRNAARDELRERFAENVDFLHYIGHVEDGAFVCHDGRLDADALPTVGVDAFLINGCRSYEIGTRVVERGSVGGITTLSEVGNRDAIGVGRFVARLLNNGFTLRSAVSMARSTHFTGNQYVVVGDGGTTVAQSWGGVPNSCRIEPVDDETYRLQLRLNHVDSGIGAQYIPYLDGVDQHFLSGRRLPAMELTGDELARFLQLEQILVEYDGTFCWSTDDRFSTL